MYGALLAYIGLLLLLLVSKLYPVLGVLPYLYMLFPLLILEEERIGFKNYLKGVLWGSLFLPLLFLFPPEISCPAWFLNQLGVATAEEIFFRGFLMAYLGNVKTSLLFSLAHFIHFPTLNSVLVFFPSLLFGEAFRRSGSIVAPIGLHLSANLFYFSFVEKFPELNDLLQRELTGG